MLPKGFSSQISTLEFMTLIRDRFGEKTAFGMRFSDRWETLSYRHFYDRVLSLAGFLKEQGIRKGDHVIVVAKSSPEFGIAFFANCLAGAVTIPLDARLNTTDQSYICDFSDGKMILFPDSESEKIAYDIAEKLPRFKGKVFATTQSSAAEVSAFRESHILSGDLTLIAFTSGTVSSPKGVMLTWEQLTFEIQGISTCFGDLSDLRMLSILPLHHMFEIMAGFLTPLANGGEVNYANTMLPHQIVESMQVRKIRDILVVPLFLKALKKGIEAEIFRSRIKLLWYRAASWLAKVLPVKGFRRWVMAPIHKKLGGNLRRIISGASALDLPTAAFFENMGIDVFEGYGLTETAPIVTANTLTERKHGTVGKAFPGVDVRLDEETKEVLVRGPNVMKGYYKNPEATAACLSSEGWFNTGDVGELDEDGFLKIVGRTKELIVLASGKKVVPEDVEDFFLLHPDIQEACVIGGVPEEKGNDKHEAVVLVAVLKPDVLSRHSSSKVEAESKVIAELRRYSLGLSYYKRPARILLQTAPLPRTSTLKLKRTLVKSQINNRLRE